MTEVSNSDFEAYMHCDRILSEVTQIISAQDQLEVAAEIAENLRYIHTQISWLQRIPDSGARLALSTKHTHLEHMSGNLIHSGSQFIGIDTGKFTLLIKSSEVLWIQGLCAGQIKKINSDFGQAEVQILLHEIADQQLKATFYLGADATITGRIISVFKDSFSVVTETAEVTLILTGLVGIQIPN